MGERWTRPALVAREPPPAWRAAWRFRLVALLLLALLLIGAALLFRELSGATAQNPGIGAAPAGTGRAAAGSAACAERCGPLWP